MADHELAVEEIQRPLSTLQELIIVKAIVGGHQLPTGNQIDGLRWFAVSIGGAVEAEKGSGLGIQLPGQPLIDVGPHAPVEFRRGDAQSWERRFRT